MGIKKKMTVADLLSRRIAGLEYSLQLVAQALGRINARVDLIIIGMSKRKVLTRKRLSARLKRK